MNTMPQPGPISKQRLDQFSRFVNPTISKGNEDYANRIRPTIGKELSTSFLQREDMSGLMRMGYVAEVFVLKGQDKTAQLIMNWMLRELEGSRSIEGWFGEEIMSGNKMEYTQTQNVHEYQHEAKKKGWFR